MRNSFLIMLLTIALFGCKNAIDGSNDIDKTNENIITSDIDNFWSAYDKIITTEDTIEQVKYLKEFFLNKASEGQKSMIIARNYSEQEYISSIKNSPEFWKSIRKETYQAKTIGKELEVGIGKLKSIYPELNPAKIYFTVGVLRSGGTTLDNSVLIGSELAFANKNTPTEEFPENLSHLKSYFDSEPSENIVFLNIHEYIHTQQKTTIGDNLLAQTVLEGVAEFVAEKALNIESPSPQITFGRENDAKIKAKFEVEMFSPNIYNWIWNSADNEFGMRDLAYYVGYRICEGFYNNAIDKEKAIREMIQLDYNNESELIEFVENSGYFSKRLKIYKDFFESSRPRVTGVGGIENKSVHVNSDISVLTISFSQEMDSLNRGFEFGPLGEENVIKINDYMGFSDDGKSVSFGIEKLAPSKIYQIIVSPRFCNVDGVPLIPYLIEFQTADK